MKKRLSYLLIALLALLMLVGCSVFKKKEKGKEINYEQNESKAASFREAMQIDYEFFGGEGVSGFLPFDLLRDPHFLPLPELPNHRPIRIESGDIMLEFVQSDSGFQYTAKPKKTASSSIRFERENEQKTESEEKMDFAEWYEFTKEVKKVPTWIWLIIALIILLLIIWRIIRPKFRL